MALTPTLEYSGEIDLIVAFAEVLDLGVAARLLPAEIVGGEAEHHKSLWAVLAVERLQALVLAGVATLAGGIDHQHHLAGIGAQAPGFAVDILEAVIEQRWTRGSGMHGGGQKKGGEEESEFHVRISLLGGQDAWTSRLSDRAACDETSA